MRREAPHVNPLLGWPLAVVGGVACNSRLREKLQAKAKSEKIYFPKPLYCTDNAAMIGRAAWDLREHLPVAGEPHLDVRLNLKMMGS